MSAQYPPNDPQLEEMADRVQSLVDLVVAARLRAEADAAEPKRAPADGLRDGEAPRKH